MSHDDNTQSHPYRDLPSRAFWRRAVAKADRTQFPGLYQPKVAITPTTRVATAGSCFAQHIGNYLGLAGCNVLQAEPAPRGMSDQVASHFGYGTYSARYGNIYSPRQLRQLLEDVIADHADPELVWAKDDGFVDAMRPAIEPHGLRTIAEVLLHRRAHLARVRQMLPRTDVFIFTLGLTECWLDRETSRAFPTCPGVVAGTFDPDKHAFHNFTHAEITDDLTAIHALLRRFNPEMSMLLTVSPVPLTATATDAHVLAATTYSKSVLRAAAGEFTAQRTGADYFPSYEIVTAPASGGPWFAPNMRSVTTEGVEKVMAIFLSAHGLLELDAPDAAPDTFDEGEDDLVCEDLLLQAFAK